MALISTILGFSLWGLASRVGQLGIQKRNLLDNPGGHVLAMGAFGFAGYWAHVWEERSTELIAQKRAQIAERRRKQVEAAEAAGNAGLAAALQAQAEHGRFF
ncbi:hypothetical protein OF83DRAFT_1055420 [Amylostereum chailletii]|nr:hypothetical protein OF83DRAFT_1055420 [Amylostereum chailletii]